MAWQVRARSFFVILAAINLLFGCSQEQRPLSNSYIARMLQNHQTAHCDRQTIFIRAGKFGTGQEQYFENWFDNSVLTDGRFIHLTDSTDKTTRRGTFLYSVWDNSFHVTWLQSDPSDMPTNDTLTIIGCVYVPSSIKIIDASFDASSETARIMFAEKFRLSLLGQMMSDKGMLKKYNPITPPEGFEYIALLNKSQLGQWRIAGVGVN